MRKKLWKRALATALSLSMVVTVFSNSSDVVAKQKTTAKQQKKVTESALKEKLATMASTSEYPKGLISFSESQISCEEGNSSQLTIVRAGGTKGKAKVTIKAIDVSAKYGDDYVLSVKEDGKETILEKTGDTQTLLEKYSDSLASVTTNEKKSDTQKSKDDKTSVNTNLSEVSTDSLKGLSKAAASQNASISQQKDWREIEDEKNEDYKKAQKIMSDGNDKVKDALNDINGAEYTFTFKDGEYKKVIDISTIDDDISEGEEQVLFALSDASGAKLSPNNTGYLNIVDNESAEVNTYEMVSDAVSVKRGAASVDITIKKTSGINQLSMVNVGTSSINAKAGKDYESINESVVFPAGMKEKTVSVPLVSDSDTKDDVYFYVGLQAENGVINTKKNATVVQLTAKAQESDAIYSQSSKASSKALDMKTQSKSVAVFDSDKRITVDNRANSTSSASVVDNLDLRTAESITYKFDSDEGSTSVKSGCDTTTVRGRSVKLTLKGNGSSTNITSTGNRDSLSVSETWNIPDNMKKKNMSVEASVKTEGDNKNATLHVRKIQINYVQYTVQIDNTGVSDTGKILNSNIGFEEKNYTRKNKCTILQRYNLGSAMINGDSSRVFNNADDTLSFSKSYNNNVTTVSGKKIDSSNTDFIGYEIYNKSYGRWETLYESSYKNDTYSVRFGDFYTRYKTYADNSIIKVRPKFKVKTNEINLLNNGNTTIDKTVTINKNTADGSTSVKTEKVTVNKSTLGSFTNYNNNTTMTVNALDRVEIAATPSKGYSVYGFSTYCKSGEVSQIQTGNVSKIYITPSGYSGKICVDINYEQSGIKVMANPKGQNTDKGSVLYYDKDEPSKSLSGDKNNPIVIPDVSVSALYSIIALSNQNYNSDKNLVYRASWMDGTLDTNESGTIQDLEQAADSSYKGFSAVSGDVLSFTPTRAFSKIYYDFVLREKKTDVADMSYIEGRIRLKDEPIFKSSSYKPVTNTKNLPGLNGVTVTTEGESEVTKYYAGDKYTKSGDGYFCMSGDGSYSPNDHMLLSANYIADDGSTLYANTVVTPNVFQDIVFSTDSVMQIDSAEACAVVDGKEVALANGYKSLNSGDHTFRLKFNVTSKNKDIQPRGAILHFYNSSGNEIKNAQVSQTVDAEHNGQFSLDFNPKKLGLSGGTTIKLQIVDQNGKKLYSRDTGITLIASVGNLDFINSFNFGGANTAIKLIGAIDSVFDLGWNGEFDDPTDTSGNITTTEEDGITYKTLVLGLGKSKDNNNIDLKSVKKAAGKKAETQKEYLEETIKQANSKNPDEEALKKKKEKMEEAAKKFDDEFDTASNPKKTSSTVAANVGVDFNVSLMIRLAVDKEHNSALYFDTMILNASVKAGAGVEVEFATPIGVTITLGFAVNVDGSATFIVAQDENLATHTKYYVTEVKNEKILKNADGKIDLFGLDDSSTLSREGIFYINPEIQISAGANVAGLVGVNVFGSAKFNMNFYTSSKQNSGSVTLDAGIGIKVLFISASWTFVSTNINLFGNSSTSSLGLDEQNYLHDTSKMFGAGDKEYLENRGRWNTADVSAKSLDENKNGVSEAKLLQGIYNGTDVSVKALNSDGDYLGVFLDDELDADGKQVRSSINSAAAYYTLYDHTTGTWSKPVLIENDKTVDQDVNIFDLGDRGLMVTWSSANKEFTDSSSRVNMMNSMDIHGAFFDKNTKSFGSIMNITSETTEKSSYIGSDNVGDVSPNVVYSGNSLLVYYTKNEYKVSDSKEGEVVGDIVYPDYSLMAYRQYTFSSDKGTDGKWISDYAELANKGKTKNELKGDYDNYVSSSKDFAAAYPSFDAYYADYVSTWYGQVFFNTIPDVYLDEKLNDEGYWTDDKEPDVYASHTVSTSVSTSNKDGQIIKDENTKVTGTNTVTSAYAPKIMDTDAISYNGLGLFAYTVDYDQNLSTVNDRDVYIQTYDFETGEMTHPIIVTSDNVSDSNVKFTRVYNSKTKVDETYLTWLSDGNITALNISNVIKNCLVKKTTDDGQEYYIIDKSSKGKYNPASVMVKGEVNEEAEGAVSSITSFDVASANGYIYTSWTEKDTELKDGVEENTPESVKASNQLAETQIYMARYDFSEGTMTSGVQVTSAAGANYDNISFVVNSDSTLTALATRADSKVVTADDFNKIINENNKNVPADEKQDEVTTDKFNEYVAEDSDNKTLVALNITPKSVMKIQDVSLEDMVQGEENYVSFTLKNDGIDTLKNAVLTATDANGKSVLVKEEKTTQDDVTTSEYKSVDSITIDRLLGGEDYNAVANLKLSDSVKNAELNIKLTDASGNVLAQEKYTSDIEQTVDISDMSVEQTDTRDVYDVSFTVNNSEYSKMPKGKATVGIQTEKGDVSLVTVSIPELDKSQKQSFTTQVKVDSAKQFIIDKDDSGFVTETGNFYVTYADCTETESVERSATAAQLEQINAISEGMIEKGKTITIKKGQIKAVNVNVKSSLADSKKDVTGTEGIETVWKSSNDSIVTVDDAGYVTAMKKGNAKLTAYVIPKKSEAVATVTEDQKGDYNFAETESNLTKLPNEAIKTYTVNVKVSDTAAVSSVTKKGITYKISGKNAKVTAAKKSIKTATIPDSVKIGTKTLKVTEISKNTFKNCKKLKKVVIGKNVTKIGANAFNGAKKLKLVIFKAAKTPKLEKNVFKGIYKKAVFKTPKKSFKKYKKVLNKKTGVTAKMQIKKA